MSKPLIAVGQPVSLGIGSRQILKVPRPVPFEAVIYISVDGHDYAEAGTLTSTKGSSVTAKLPEGALAVGAHHVRVRARMTFSGQPSHRWTEERQLPDVTYAVYDPRSPGSGAAPLLLAPTAISASALDQNLPDVPTGKWLAGVLGRAEAKRAVEWMTQYCVERTRKMISRPAAGDDLCAVAYFEAKGDILRAWFRTGSVRFTEAGPVWTVAQPSFQGIDTSSSGTALTTLSALPALLDTPRESWPTADLAIDATDISVEMPRPDWAIITVTVRNNGPCTARRSWWRPEAIPRAARFHRASSRSTCRGTGAPKSESERGCQGHTASSSRRRSRSATCRPTTRGRSTPRHSTPALSVWSTPSSRQPSTFVRSMSRAGVWGGDRVVSEKQRRHVT